MQWSARNSSAWTQPEVGNWTATCIRVIDLGTQENEYQGKVNHRRQSLIIWEIPDQTDNEGRPLTISKAYTASLGDKATLRQHLESWRGRAFTSEELAGFDPKNLLGKPCLLNLVKVQGRKGEKVVISTVSPIPKGMTAPPAPLHEMFIYSLENHDEAVWSQLSDGIKGWIGRSLEHQNQPTQASQPPIPARKKAEDDDIPF